MSDLGNIGANSEAERPAIEPLPPRRRGRPPGVPNRVTRCIRAQAVKKGPWAFRGICKLATDSKDERIKLAALKEILERGYGRSVAPAELSGPNGEALFPSPPLSDLENARLIAFMIAKGTKEVDEVEAARAAFRKLAG